MKQHGFIALSLVIIIMATTLLIASTVGFLAIGEGQSSLSLLKGEQSLLFAEGCMEDALLKSRASDTYTGGVASISRPEGTCDVLVIKDGTLWVLYTAPTNTAYKRAIEAVVLRVTTGVFLLSWKEV